MRVVLGCDHQGLDLKNDLLQFLNESGHHTGDVGCFDKTSVDWPDIAKAVAQSVASGAFERGILICGTGVGMSVAANKVKGVRAARCQDTFSVRLSREHNDANVLCLGGWIVGPRLARDLAKAFLETKFEGGRHERRLEKVRAMEQNL